MAKLPWIPRVGPITLIVAVIFYVLAGITAIYVGTIAELPAGALFGLALFGVATYALRLLFHPRKAVPGDDEAV